MYHSGDNTLVVSTVPLQSLGMASGDIEALVALLQPMEVQGGNKSAATIYRLEAQMSEVLFYPKDTRPEVLRSDGADEGRR